MIRRILAIGFFLVLIVPDMLGWEVSLAPGLSIKNVFLYLLFIGLGLQMAVEGRFREIELPTVHLIFLLLIFDAIFMWLFASMVANYRNYDAADGLIALKGLLIDHYLVFLVYFYLLRTGDDAMWVMERILWITVAINTLIVIDSYDIPDLGIVGQDELGRVQGALDDHRAGANEYARFLILFLPALLFGIVTAAGRKRYIYMAGVLMSAAALILTTSRGAFIGLFAGFLVAAFYLRRLVPLKTIAKPAAAIVVGTILMGIVASSEFSQLFYARFVENASISDVESATSGRNVIWGNALVQQAQAPYTFLIGYGWRAYTSMDFRYGTHNHYLSYLFNLGAVGLGLFLALSAQIIRLAKQGAELTDGAVKFQLLAFIIGSFCLLIAVFFSEIFRVWLFFWAYAGIAMRMCVGAMEVVTPTYIDRRMQKQGPQSASSSRGENLLH
ncbi:MAG: O-antigen ligase family protein [Gammaproteobacteria bacterium]